MLLGRIRDKKKKHEVRRRLKGDPIIRAFLHIILEYVFLLIMISLDVSITIVN